MRYMISVLCLLAIVLFASTGFGMTLPLSGDWNPTQDFGVRNRCWDGYHLGEDVVRSLEVPVYAIAAGHVQFARQHITAYGYPVIIEHSLPDGTKYCSFYGHLRLADEVANNVDVVEGQIIGYLTSVAADNQGTIHLHSGIRLGSYASAVSIYLRKPSINSECEVTGYTWEWNWQFVGYTRNANNTQRTDEPYDITHETMKAQWRSTQEFVEANGNTFLATQTGYSVSPSGPYTPGQTIECTIYWRNDGTATWDNTTGSGKNYVELGSCNSSSTIVTSYLYASGLGWLNDKVPCTMSQSTITPGNTATFHFYGKVPTSAQPGQVPIYFGPVYASQIMQGWNGNGFTIQVTSPPPLTGTNYLSFVGYFNNDNLTDIGLLNTATGNWYIAMNNGSNEFVRATGAHAGAWITGWGDGTEGSHIPLVGDFNNDGLYDLCILQTSTGNWFVAYNNGVNEFVRATGPYNSVWITSWGNGAYHSHEPLVGNFNDGTLNDVCIQQVATGNWFVAMNNGSNEFVRAYGPYNNAWITGWGDGAYGSNLALAGNFGGSSLTDILTFQTSTGNWFVAYNNGASEFVRAPGPYGNAWITSWGNGSYGSHVPLVGKFNGDGLKDICIQQTATGNWFVALNNGSNEFVRAYGPYNNAWITGWGDGAFGSNVAHAGYFNNDNLCDILTYQPGTGHWFVATNNGSNEFVRAPGPYNNSWINEWGRETGSPKISSPENEGSGQLPLTFSLSQNYPNPFNPVTTISYTLPAATHVALDIYNILGQKVATLVNEKQEVGDHTAQWDGKHCSSGVYLYRISTDQAVETKKMLLLK